MPPVRKAVRKSAKSTRRNAATSRKRQGMSSAHKAALAQGRAMSATVDRYLAAVNTPKRRGRKVSRASLEQRLSAAEARFKSARGVEKVLAAQAIRDLRTRLSNLASATGGDDLRSLEAAFVKIAKKFSANRGITYGAWREAGVPAKVLERAGITRTRR